MVQVYDAKTKKPVDIDLSTAKANEELASGKLIIPKGETLNVVAPDGKYGSADAKQLPQLLASGYHLETPKEAEINTYLEQNKGLKGQAKAAVAGLANEATFGAAGQLYSPELQALQKENPWSSGAGSAVGFTLPFLASGPLAALGKVGDTAATAVRLGKTAEEVGLGTKILSAAAKYGTENALLAAPQAAALTYLKKPDEAGEHLLISLGAGASLGALGPLLKSVGKPIAGALGKPFGYDPTAPDALNKFSDHQDIKSFFAGQFKKGWQGIDDVGEAEVAKVIKDNNLSRALNESRETSANRVNEVVQDKGSIINSLMNQAESNGAKIIPTKDLIARIRTDVVDQLTKNASKQTEAKAISTWLNDFDNISLTNTSERSGLAKELDQLQSLKNNNASSDLINQQQAKIESLTNQLADNHSYTSGELWGQIKGLDDRIYAESKSFANPNPLDKEFRKVRSILRDELNTSIDNLDPDLLKKIQDANQEYRGLKTLQRISDNSVSQANSNRNLSLTDNLTGLGFGASTGNPLLGLAASMGHNFIRENGNQLLAKTARMLANTEYSVPTALANLSKNKEIAITNTGSRAFDQLLGQNYKSDEEAFDHLNKGVIAAYQNPNQHLSNVNTALESVDPKIAQAYINQNKKVVDYLYNALPKNPTPPMPFQSSKWKPNKQQLRDLKDKVNIINNPFNSIDLLKNGRLNANHVDALKNVYPSVYSNMVNQIMEYGANNPKMPYQHKLQLSLLTGVNLDPTLDNVAFYQQAYAENQDKQQSNGKNIDLPGSEPTQMQRISEA